MVGSAGRCRPFNYPQSSILYPRVSSILEGIDVRQGTVQLAFIEDVAQVVEDLVGGGGVEQVHDHPLGVEQLLALGAEAVELTPQAPDLGGFVRHAGGSVFSG